MGVTDTMPEGAADHRAEYGASITGVIRCPVVVAGTVVVVDRFPVVAVHRLHADDATVIGDLPFAV
jgi:hypothetical protein